MTPLSFEALHEPLSPILRVLLASLPHPDGVLLDVGCGAGTKETLWTEAFGPATPIVGVDIDPDALQQAARGRLRPLSGDAQALPLRAASCGAAVCIATLGVLADQRAVLRELRRVIRPGGWALVATAAQIGVMHIPWPAALCRRMAALLSEQPALERHLLLGTPEPATQIAALLQSAGWETVDAGAFLLDSAAEPALARALPLLPWAMVRPHLARRLPRDELRDCDAIAARAEPDLLTLALAAVATVIP